MKITALLASWQKRRWLDFYGPLPIFPVLIVYAIGLWALLDICKLSASIILAITIVVLLLLKLAMYYSLQVVKVDFEDEFGVEYKPPYHYEELRRIHDYVHKHILVLALKIHNFSGTVPREWKEQFRYALKLAHVMRLEEKFKTIRDYIKSDSLPVE